MCVVCLCFVLVEVEVEVEIGWGWGDVEEENPKGPKAGEGSMVGLFFLLPLGLAFITFVARSYY